MTDIEMYFEENTSLPLLPLINDLFDRPLLRKSRKSLTNTLIGLEHVLNKHNSLDFVQRTKIIDEKGWSCYATEGCAGFDLRSTERKTLYPHQRVLVSTGVKIAKMDYNIQGQITSKSGIALKNRVIELNLRRIIDPDYKDEIKVILYNTSNKVYFTKEGQAIA
ncbi:deoxyuridine 5'-triphosphate nucleotidohydrolase-like [Hydra vulgaris]|uniref:Deoxyuridine 5'-triphosphate nucleotidohydrolase n=1 Tax=Hydra vulgaris TaxID=6087 RepID=A0ABM4D100_HYDVU